MRSIIFVSFEIGFSIVVHQVCVVVHLVYVSPFPILHSNFLPLMQIEHFLLQWSQSFNSCRKCISACWISSVSLTCSTAGILRVIQRNSLKSLNERRQVYFECLTRCLLGIELTQLEHDFERIWGLLMNRNDVAISFKLLKVFLCQK